MTVPRGTPCDLGAVAYIDEAQAASERRKRPPQEAIAGLGRLRWVPLISSHKSHQLVAGPAM